jgi:hypothetical protein
MIRLGLFGTGDVLPVSVAMTAGTILVVGGFGLRFFNRSEAKALDAL